MVRKYSEKEILELIDKKAEERREYILNTPNSFTGLGDRAKEGNKIYYISENGNDKNDGISPETAWATVSKLNSAKLSSGDIVLFERGGEYRGKITLANGVTYSAYGEGPKPIINGSGKDFADPELWEETDVPNVYRARGKFSNVGNIVFNYSGEIGSYGETVGCLRIYGAQGFEDYDDLKNDLEFCCSLTQNTLYLCSTEGNPGERFESVEICEEGNILSGSAADVTLDNLTVIFGGSHGMGSGTVENRTVQNCIFAWIGGSILKGFNGGNTTRYGNAIEVYGGCNGYYVYDNWIYQIYDTGITHQYSTDDTVIKMQNIEYSGNLIERCHWSIEYYNRGKMPGSYLRDIYVHDNTVLYGAYGWGSLGRESGAALHNSFEIVGDVENYVVENNIFAYSKGNIVRYCKNDKLITFRGNTYVQFENSALGYMFGENVTFNEEGVKKLTDDLREKDAVIAYVTKCRR